MQTVLAHEFQLYMEPTYDSDGSFTNISVIFADTLSEVLPTPTSHQIVSVREQGTLFWLAFLYCGVAMVLAGSIQPRLCCKAWVNM